MNYGTIKVDQITFTNAGVDQTLSVSGIVQSISGGITVTGTVQGETVIGTSTVSGATVTGNTGEFTSITAATGVFTSYISGLTITGDSAQFITVTGGSAGFTTITGATVTGTTANFATLSGQTITGGHVTTASGTYTGNVTAAAFVPTGSSIPTNGVYLPAANSVALSTSGVGRVFVDSSGNVKVGAPSTAAPFNVQGVGGIGIDIAGRSSDGGAQLRLMNNAGTVSNTAIFGGDTYGGMSSATYLAFQTASSERLRITAAGLVGIGVSDPVSPLHIQGAEGSAQLTISNTSLAASDGDFLAGINFLIRDNNDATGAVCTSIRSIADQNHTLTAKGTALTFSTTPDDTTTLTERLRIDQAGRVGIGTTSPTDALQVANGNILIGTGGSSAGYRALYFGSSDTASARFSYIEKNNDSPFDFNIVAQSSTTAASTINFKTTPTSTAATIDSSGRLLVGTSTVVASDVKLEVRDGILAVTNSSGSDVRVFLGGSTSPNHAKGQIRYSLADDSLEFYANSAERMRITSTGNIGMSAGLTLGSSTPTPGGFYSTAAILGTGAGTNAVKFSTTTGKITYDTSSRLNKENIEDCPYGIAEIKQLQPRRYYRIDDQRLEVGFVADEVVGILPEFVPFGPKSAITGNEQDTEEIPLGVNYEKLTAVLTAALQEAVAKIESLEARLTAAGI